MAAYPFHYEVIAVDPLENYTFRESGIGFCRSYTEAMIYIEKYYGEELIAVKHLELLEESDLIIMPKRYINEYVNDSFSYPCEIKCDANGKVLV
jgi:hypothetical protein